MFQVLLAIDEGKHIEVPGSEVIECVAYRLDPTTAGSFNDLDGEVVESGPIQAKVVPASVQTFCKP